jgi:hypothetical protein
MEEDSSRKGSALIARLEIRKILMEEEMRSFEEWEAGRIK